MRQAMILPALLLLLAGCGGTPMKEPKSENLAERPQFIADPGALRAKQTAREKRTITRSASWEDFRRDDAVSPAPPYTLGNGDVLSVELYAKGENAALEDKMADVSRDYIVSGDGTITIRYAGKVPVEGKTLKETQAAIQERLAPLYLSPRVTVTLKAPRKRYVTVNGLPNPGRVELDGKKTLLEILTEAGWNMHSSAVRGVLIIRGRDAVRQINLGDITENYQLRHNIVLRDGDIIIPAPDSAPVTVNGEVRTSGITVPVPRWGYLSVARALSAAQGVTSSANLNAVRILRADGTEELVDVQKAVFGDPETVAHRLYPGDELFVSSASGRGFYAFGSVQNAGFISVETEFDMVRALALVGVDQFEADMGSTVLIRNRGTEAPEIYNVHVDQLLEGDMTQNMSVRPGDVIYVPKRGLAVSLEYINRLLSPLSGSASFGLQIQQAARDTRR